MATRLYLRNSISAPGLDVLNRDLLRAGPGSGSTNLNTDTEAGGTSIQVGTGGSGTTTGALGLTSERVAETFTLSGAVTINIWAYEATSLVNANLRATLWKRTEGGSDVETFIASGDRSTELPAAIAAAQNWTITPAAGVSVGVNERLVLRLYVIPVGGTMGAQADGVQIKYDATTAQSAESWIELTETVTFLDNATKLYLRRTAENGIGNFFDLLPERGSSAFTTGVVNTVASGTDIQWTRTAGGTLLEWITPRLGSGFVLKTVGSLGTAVLQKIWMFESAAQANCCERIHVYRWRNSVETLVGTIGVGGTEFSTSAALRTQFLLTVTETVFLPDDRFILRMNIVNAGTMGDARTCTLNYDHNVADVNGDSYIVLFWTPSFKAETDPPESGQSAMTMGGVGN